MAFVLNVLDKNTGKYVGIDALKGDPGDVTMINGHKIVEMEKSAFETAVKDPNTYYFVYDPTSGIVDIYKGM